jgi:hypothetical protein
MIIYTSASAIYTKKCPEADVTKRVNLFAQILKQRKKDQQGSEHRSPLLVS